MYNYDPNKVIYIIFRQEEIQKRQELIELKNALLICQDNKMNFARNLIYQTEIIFQ